MNFSKARFKTKTVTYMEVGIDQGNTTMKICRLLPPKSSIYLFDTLKKCNNVRQKIKKHFANKEFNIRCFSSEITRYRDNYNWHLADLYAEGVKVDYVYIDGSHDFTIDCLCFFIVEKMLNERGYIEFDDYNWCFNKSKSFQKPHIVNNPNHPQNLDNQYPKDQQGYPHIKKLVDIFVKTNDKFQEIVLNRLYRLK